MIKFDVFESLKNGPIRGDNRRLSSVCTSANNIQYINMDSPLELQYTESDRSKWLDKLIEKSSETPRGCIEWGGTVNSEGYGVLKLTATSLIMWT